MSNHAPLTIAEAEDCIQKGLERLRDVPLSEPIAQALSFVAPKGYRLVVQLEEDGRKKRSTASVSNWNHDTGEIVMFFEPIAESHVTEAPQPRALSPETPNAQAPILRIPVVDEPSGQQVRECCMALAEAEKMGRQFYALKWFRDTYLVERGYAWTASVQERQRILNRAIQDGFIDTQTIPNPKNPAFPTNTLLLNREKAKEFVSSRFRPTGIKGEALSATGLCDRG